jgi:hypothetical protein
MKIQHCNYEGKLSEPLEQVLKLSYNLPASFPFRCDVTGAARNDCRYYCDSETECGGADMNRSSDTIPDPISASPLGLLAVRDRDRTSSKEGR